MDSYGFDSKGPFLVQSVASRDAWQASDEGRLIYDQSDDGLYYGSSTQWVLLSIDSGFVAGTKMYFYQNTAPTGWTIDTAVVDSLLSVKGGTHAYNVAGGNLAGTWTQTGHTHTTADHTLTIAEIPNHTHTIAGAFGYYGVAGALSTVLAQTAVTNVGATGGSGAHNHGSTTTSAEANTYRPYAAVGIICTKS